MTELYVERAGEGLPILFIHGSGWNRRMWYGQRDRLQSLAKIVLLDLPGHGGSRGDGCDSVEEYGAAIVDTIKELGLGKCVLAGHSLGGAIALSVAIDNPDLVGGLILIGTGARLRVLPRILGDIVTNKQETVKSIVDLAFSPTAPQDLKKADFDETMKCDSAVIRKDFTACDRFDVMSTVSSITVPTLILCGTDDALTPPRYSEYLHQAIDGSHLVLIEGAGHMVMMEKPEEVNDSIAHFLASRQTLRGRT
jgi:pimeloyl-ACP methyl ester carboxylesterase